MFNSPIDARDELFALFWAGWEANANVVALSVETRWQGKDKGDIPDGYWARVSTQGVGTDPGGFLQNGVGASAQVYDTFGHMFVEVFAPMSGEDAHRNGELLAIDARNIFMATETLNGVWFRRARYVEVPNDGKHYRWKVTVEYEFSETRSHVDLIVPGGGDGEEWGGIEW